MCRSIIFETCIANNSNTWLSDWVQNFRLKIFCPQNFKGIVLCLIASSIVIDKSDDILTAILFNKCSFFFFLEVFRMPYSWRFEISS